MKNLIYRPDLETFIFWACARMGKILDDADAALAAIPLSEAVAEKRRRHLVMKRIHEQFSQACAALIAYNASGNNWMQEEVVAHLPEWIGDLLLEWDGFLKDTLKIMNGKPDHPAQASFAALLICFNLFSDIYEIFGQKESAEKEAQTY